MAGCLCGAAGRSSVKIGEQREIENNAPLFRVEFVDLACLDRNRANRKYAFWHMAGSNIKGELDAHVCRYA